MPLEKLQYLREKERLGMEKHRHPLVTTSNPCTIDATMDSSLLPQVNHMRPMEAIQTPTSSQLPTSLLSTSSEIQEEDIQVFEMLST